MTEAFAIAYFAIGALVVLSIGIEAAIPSRRRAIRRELSEFSSPGAALGLSLLVAFFGWPAVLYAWRREGRQ